jgi:hypothetical protein
MKFAVDLPDLLITLDFFEDILLRTRDFKAQIYKITLSSYVSEIDLDVPKASSVNLAEQQPRTLWRLKQLSDFCIESRRI